MTPSRHARWIWTPTILTLLIGLAPPAAAQNFGRKGGGATVRTGGGGDVGGDRDAGDGKLGDTGTARATISKYEVEESAEQPDAIGTLKVRLIKEAKSVTFTVPSSLTVEFGTKRFTPDEFEQILLKGLEVDVTWDAETSVLRKSKTKTLRRIAPFIYDIEGEVDEFDTKAEALKVAAVRQNKMLWPDQEMEKEKTAKNARGAKKEITPAVRKVRVHAIENVSKVADELSRPISLLDLEHGRAFRAKVALAGRSDAYVIEFIAAVPDEEKLAAKPAPSNPPPTDDRSGEPQNPEEPPKLRFGP